MGCHSMIGKTDPPLHWVNPHNIALVAVEMRAANSARPYRDAPNRPYFDILNSEQAPWLNQELLSFLDNCGCRQIAIFAGTLTANVTALTMMTSERGHDVFLVSDAVNSASPNWLHSLGRTHAILIDEHRFREEWELALQRK